ncbi:MAG: N-formylglutamate amidohydrolase [Planctomycetia bacterium]|nr:N-formylglutamate amidohydrolase [Planctomycetia bacterium]
MHRLNKFAMLPLLLPSFVALAPAAPDSPKPEDFVTVQKGTLPIILSAPHGGRKKVPDVPERVGKGLKNFQTVLDTNTAEMTEKLVAELEKALDGKPWVVIARFERKYADVNRSAEQGYESDKAKPYYDAYHSALESACKAVRKQHRRGILLDIHGNGVHPGAICRGTLNGKTVTLLKERDGWAAINGKNSVLGRMEKLGYKIMPPGNAQNTAKEERQFTGGFIVSNYGSHTAYAIDAIQLEFGSILRNKNTYATTAKDLAEAIRVFHDSYLK